MPDNLRQILHALESLDFSGKGEAFVEARFLPPLLECLGYETHKDYEVIRHGDESSTFKLHYPPVENGAKRVKHYNPDYMPTIRKKMFWIIEAKSPIGVAYPFDIQYLVQGLQYAIHPEIQAKYVLITNGIHSAVYDAHGGVYLEKEIYEPILEFRASELIQKWVEIFDLLSVERLRTRIEIDLKAMFDKLCLSSVDQTYPKRLLSQIGSSVGDNVLQIEKHVRELYVEGITKEIDAQHKLLEQLDPKSLFSEMDTPLANGPNTEGHRFVEKSLASDVPALEIFDRLTSDFERQGIFRKIQTFVALCTLYRRADGKIQELCQNFFDQYKDAELPLLNQVECALLRWTRKFSTVSHYPLLRLRLQQQLESAPEFIRFVRPPTVLEHLYPFELLQNRQTFAQIKYLSEQQLKNCLTLLLKIESEIENDYKTAYSGLSDTEKQIGGFENYGMGGKYPFFRILISRGLQPQ